MTEISDKCFECNSVMELQDHHIIPRSLGGKKTVKLCGWCHGKIHGLNFTNHSTLIKIALDKKKERGEPIGKPQGSTVSKIDILKNHLDIYLCLLDNMSIRKTAIYTGKSGSTVQRIKKILDNEQG